MGGNAPSVLSPPSLDLKITAPSFIAWAAFRSRRSRRQQARLLFAFREHRWRRVSWTAIMLREKNYMREICKLYVKKLPQKKSGSFFIRKKQWRALIPSFFLRAANWKKRGKIFFPPCAKWTPATSP